MKKRLVLALALFVSVSIASELRADIVFNNFGAGDSHSTTASWAIGGFLFWEHGGTFQVSGADYTLDSIEAAVASFSGTNQMTMTLYSTSGGLPTTALESATITGLGSSATINTFNFAGTTVLQDGATYALIASAAADGNESDLGWYFSDSDLGHVFRNNSFSWNFDDEGNAPAFRVNGTVVPEPTNISMFGAAMIGLSFASRRRRVA